MQLDYFTKETIKSLGKRQKDMMLLPVPFLEEDEFKKIGYSTKILYSLLVDKANRTDSEFVIYLIDDIKRDMCCQSQLAVKMLQELENLGLIRKERQGMGRPNLIYVNDFYEVYPQYRP